MALKIGIASFVSAGYTNPVRWDLVEKGTGIKIDEHVENDPHDEVYIFEWTENIRDIVYEVRFYDVPGGVGLGNLERTHDVTPSTNTISLYEPIELIVDGGEAYDPVAGNNTVVVPDMIGKEVTSFQQRLTGHLRQTREVEYTFDTATGTFELTGDQIFMNSDTYVIFIKDEFIVNPSGTVGGSSSMFKGIEVKTEDYTVLSTDWGKMLIVDGAAAVITLQLGAIANITEKVVLVVESVGSTHTGVIVQASGAELITGLGTTANKFMMGKAERAWFVKVGAVLYGFTDSTDARRVGQFEWSYSVGLNRVAADGSEYTALAQPRLKRAVDDIGAVSYTVWASSVVVDGETLYPYKGQYAISDDGLSIKVPDLRNMSVRALKYLDATADAERLVQGAGGYQNDLFRAHQHYYLHPTARWGSANNGDNRNFNSTVAQSSTLSSSVGGVETRGKNIGLIPTIIT